MKMILFVLKMFMDGLQKGNKIKKLLITQKSWFNYVFKGRGYLKAFIRVRVIIQDARLAKIEPKAILEAIVSKQ